VEGRGKTREEIISRLAQRIDSFERYTTPHSALMAELSIILARRLGLENADIAAVAEAARLHDLGLYALAPAYHASPGPLTFEQRLDMWRHPVIGEQQMAKRDASRHAQLLVRWHHEWWNGTGYPDQLAFEDIPIGSRILRAVELYCSLISDRPYRTALDPSQAATTLAHSAGVECDPHVVNTFLAVVQEIISSADIAESGQGASQAPAHQTTVEEPAESAGAEMSSSQPGWRGNSPSPYSVEQALSNSPHESTAPTEPSPGVSFFERAREKARSESGVQKCLDWLPSDLNQKNLLGFEASVLRQIEFRSVAMPFWSMPRLDWYLKVWGKQILANDPAAWAATAARAMIDAVAPLGEEQLTALLENLYIPGVRLSNAELATWFGESDAWWFDNLRRGIDRLEDPTARAQALLLGMQIGDYTLSFDEQTRELRQPLTTMFWRLAGRTVIMSGNPGNASSNIPVDDFIRQANADLLYIKLPSHQLSSRARLRLRWRESWVSGQPIEMNLARGPQSIGAYLATLDRWLESAAHFRTWAIAYQEAGLASAHQVAELIKQHRPIRATYTKDISEVLGGVRSYIIVAGPES